MCSTLTIFPCTVVDRWSQSWRGVLCVIVLLSLGTIAAWRLLSRVRTLSCHLVYLLGLVFIFSPSLAFTFLLLLFLHALAFIFSVTRSFSLPGFSFFLFGHVSPCPAWPVLRGGLAALCLLLFWSRGAVLCRLGRRRCARVDNVLSGVLHLRIPVLMSTASPRSRHRGTLRLPVIDPAPRGEDGMVASAEEAESSASSTSSDRPSAVLLIVSPPRGFLAWVS